MAGPTEELRQTLAQLHDQLEQARVLDDELRRELRRTLDDIREALERPEGGSGSLADRLSELTVNFERDHPRLGETVGRLVKALSDIGI